MKKCLLFLMTLACVIHVCDGAAAPSPTPSPTVSTASVSPAPRRHPRIATPSPSPAPMRAVTPKPKRLGFFQRLFGRRPRAEKIATKPQSSPVPVAASVKGSKAVSANTAHNRPRSKPAATEPASIASPKPAPPKKSTRANTIPPEPKPETTPEPATTSETQTAPPERTENPPENSIGPATELNAESEAKEKARYNELRKKAMGDAHVSELKDKLDAASNEAEQREASKEYYSALFSKMRKLDGSLKDRIDRMEAATKRRLNRHPPSED